jgi:glycosyltransferase involved in cell wall biosynthesis
MAGIPYLVAPHGTLDRWSMARSRTKKRLAMKLLGVGDMLHRADGIQFGSVDEAAEARQLMLRAPEFAVPNGIDLSQLERLKATRLGSLLKIFPALIDRYPIALFLGRFHPKKGIHLLCDAFARARKRYPRAALLVVGLPEHGDYELQIVRRTKEPDLDGHVFMTSKLLGKEALLAFNIAHFLVMPSYQEGFSMALLEGLASGLPVLATVPCHMSALESMRAGRTVEASVEGLTEGLSWFFAKDASCLAKMGNSARRWVERDFTWSVVGRKVEDMYRTVRDRRKGRSA